MFSRMQAAVQLVICWHECAITYVEVHDHRHWPVVLLCSQACSVMGRLLVQLDTWKHVYGF